MSNSNCDYPPFFQERNKTKEENFQTGFSSIEQFSINSHPDLDDDDFARLVRNQHRQHKIIGVIVIAIFLLILIVPTILFFT